MRKGVSTHSTVDNNDGKQETLTGEGTTHDTNQTLFQLPTEKEREETVPICLQNETSLNVHGTIDCVDLFNIDEDHLHYDASTRAEPPLSSDIMDDENSRSEIDFCLNKDIIWSLAGSISGSIAGSELPKLGSWTSFNRLISNTKSLPCIQEYLPVTPHPPHPICKQYLDFMLQVIEDLHIPFVFLHSDEDIYSKLGHIMWKNPGMYQHLIFLMGGFHQLRVRQKILFKRFLCRGFKEWCIDAKIIASRSADQVWERRHYYRSMRCHKECFDALTRVRSPQITY